MGDGELVESQSKIPEKLHLPYAGWWELFLLLLRKRRRCAIEGNSMLPLLRPGQEVLVDVSGLRPKQGEVWVLRDPRSPESEMVKYILAPGESVGTFYVVGLNLDESTDSRHFGEVSEEFFVGRVSSFFLQD